MYPHISFCYESDSGKHKSYVVTYDSTLDLVNNVFHTWLNFVVCRFALHWVFVSDHHYVLPEYFLYQQEKKT